MSTYSSQAFLPISFLFIGLILSPSSLAFLSYEVNRAMDNAKACNQAQQNHVYSTCMQENNKSIKETLLRKSQQQSQNFGYSKKQKVRQNINSKIISNTKHCQDEQTRYGDSMNGERRFPYCLYENMLEILINVERNIEIYSH